MSTEPLKIDTQSVLEHAKALSQSGSEQESRVILNDLLQVEPDNIAALLMLGGSYFCEAQFEEAESIFYNLTNIAPGLGQASIALFNTLWKQGKNENALREMKRFTIVADKAKEKATLEQYLSIIKQFDH